MCRNLNQMRFCHESSGDSNRQIFSHSDDRKSFRRFYGWGTTSHLRRPDEMVFDVAIRLSFPRVRRVPSRDAKVSLPAAFHRAASVTTERNKDADQQINEPSRHTKHGGIAERTRPPMGVAASRISVHANAHRHGNRPRSLRRPTSRPRAPSFFPDQRCGCMHT